MSETREQESQRREMWRDRAAKFNQLVQLGNERQRQLERIHEDIREREQQHERDATHK